MNGDPLKNHNKKFMDLLKESKAKPNLVIRISDRYIIKWRWDRNLTEELVLIFGGIATNNIDNVGGLAFTVDGAITFGVVYEYLTKEITKEGNDLIVCDIPVSGVDILLIIGVFSSVLHGDFTYNDRNVISDLNNYEKFLSNFMSMIDVDLTR